MLTPEEIVFLTNLRKDLDRARASIDRLLPSDGRPLAVTTKCSNEKHTWMGPPCLRFCMHCGTMEATNGG